MKMESREDFEARMAQVIWDNRWKKESAYEVFTKSHMCVEGARVYALESMLYRTTGLIDRAIASATTPR